MTAVLDQPILLLMAALFGGGVFLVIAGQPLGRPRPDLLARVRELDPQHWPNRLESRSDETGTGWLGVPVIDALVQPLLEEAARFVGRALAYFGIADPREIERQLKLVAPRSSLKEYYAEHLLGPGALVATLLATDRALVELGVVHGALWPGWSYVVVAVPGCRGPVRHLFSGAVLRFNVERELQRWPSTRVPTLPPASAPGGRVWRHWSRPSSHWWRKTW